MQNTNSSSSQPSFDKTPSKTSQSRKNSSSKQPEIEQITEKMEGGIIVRRLKGKKIEP
jgi:hypothetical protein